MSLNLWRKLLISLTLTLIGLSLSTFPQASSVVLTGEVLTTAGKPIPNITVTIDAYQISAASDQKGVFRLALPPHVAEGDKLKLAINNTQYQLISPYQGIMYLPKYWNTEIISLIIRANEIIKPTQPNTVQPLNPLTEAKFIIQIASLSDQAQAEKLTTKLQPYLNTVKSYYKIAPNKPNQYHIMIGEFANATSANTWKDKLMQQQLIPKDSFVRKAW